MHVNNINEFADEAGSAPLIDLNRHRAGSIYLRVTACRIIKLAMRF